MKAYVVVILAVALNGCATSDPYRGSDDVATAAVETIRAHARSVRDHVRAGREALGLRERSDARIANASPAESTYAAREQPGAMEPAQGAYDAPRLAPRGHPARDAQMHEIRMDVRADEMLTAQGSLQPRAAQALSRMSRMAREHGGEFTITVPRARIEAAAAILAAAPEATILSTDDAEDFGLVVVTEEH